MADALCGPSNALQTFQKQTSADRTLQQDRITARQKQAEQFRSAPGPNAGILDAEFEAFQAGRPFDINPASFAPEPRGVHFHSTSSTRQPDLPSWASDFQSLQLNEVRASPIAQSQFHQYAPLERTAPANWHQDFMRQQNRSSLHKTPPRKGDERPPIHSSPLGPYHFVPLPLSISGQRQPDIQVEETFDEAAFEQAFEAARYEVQQSEQQLTPRQWAENAQDQKDTHSNSYEIPSTQGWLDDNRIASDTVLEETQERKEDRDEPSEADELARTAGQLLENVKGDRSQKFQQSNFLSLMRQLRDREVRVEGDKIIDVSQAFHPGGEHYPTE